MDAWIEWADAPSAMAIGVPFVLSSYMERTVIFDLRFWMEVPDGDLVLLRDNVIGRRLSWDSVEQVIMPKERDVRGHEVVLLPPRAPAQERERDGKEVPSYFTAKVAELSDESPRQRRKRHME